MSTLEDARRKSAEGEIRAGTTVRFSRTFTAADVEGFGRLTRDYNPVHYEPRFCRSKDFDGLICHGLLVGSMICEPGGQWAWLASEMRMRFLAPVYIGDTVACELNILHVDERCFARADATFTNAAGRVVLEAELAGYLPSTEERELLRAMLDEGDPTNALA